MTPPRHEDAYDWFSDRYQSVFVSRNRWLLTALVGLALALAQTIALVCLVPLKTSVPFLIKEETSGAIISLQPLSGNASMTYDESVRKYFLAKYVIARETYDSTDSTVRYQTVELMSDKTERRNFEQFITPSNPRSPWALYGQHTQRWVRIKSISFLNERLAQVRFTASEKNSAGPEVSSEWTAVVAFGFGPAPVLEVERLVNPLGFQVTRYRIDQEVLP